MSMKEMGARLRGCLTMRWLERLKNDMLIYGFNPEMATDRERWAVMVKNIDCRHHVDGRTRRWLVTVSNG